MSKNSCTVEPVERSVIENKLLTALNDGAKVAILLTQDDLDLLIDALCQAIVGSGDRYTIRRVTEFRRDMIQLKEAAFSGRAKS